MVYKSVFAYIESDKTILSKATQTVIDKNVAFKI